MHCVDPESDAVGTGCHLPGVAHWLLEEAALAELEPRDFRGAEAATAANTNTL